MPSHTKQPKDFDSLVDEVEGARAEVQRAVDQKRAEVVAHALRIGSWLQGSSSKPASTESSESAPEPAVVRDVAPVAEEPKAEPLQQAEPQESQRTRRSALERKGDVWLISFGGEQGHFSHLLGLAYIAELLENAGEGLQSTGLVALHGPTGPDVDTLDDTLTSDASPMPQERSDSHALREYKERALELGSEIAAARERCDYIAVEKLQDELESIVNHIQTDTGLHGRARNFPDRTERARASVTKAINRAIKAIRKQCPKTADHLKRNIETGSEPRYRDTTINWKVER